MESPGDINVQKHFLSGGGEMGKLIREKKWEDTPVGAPRQWPQSLRTTLNILLNSKFPMFLWWGKELICFYNDAYRPSLGINGKHPDILGKPAQEAWPEIWEIIKPLIDQVLQEGVATWSENQLIPIYRNGKMEDVYWTFSYSPVYDEATTPAGILVTCNETTKEVAAFKQIEESRNELSFAINAADLGTWDLNPATGKFVCNERLKEWFGLPASDEIDLELALQRIDADERTDVINSIQVALNDPSGGNYEEEYAVTEPASGVKRYLRAQGKVFFDNKGVAYRFSGIMQDVTEKVLALKKLEESRNEFRQLADSLPSLVWTTDSAGKQTFASKRWEAYTGSATGSESSFMQMTHPDDVNGLMELWRKSLETGDTYKGEVRMKNYKNEYEWFFANGVPMRNEKGQIEKWIGAFTNINEQKKAEAELLRLFHEVEEREKKFRNTVKQAPVGITIFSGEDFLVEIANDKYLELVDRKEKDFVGRPLFDSLPEVKESVQELLTGVLKTGVPYYGNEFPVTINRYGKSELTYFNFVYQPLKDNNKNVTGVIVVAMEVTASVEAKHALTESEKQFRNFIMQSPIPMTIFRGEDFVIEMANKAMFEKLWRRKEGDVIGRKIVDAFPELVEQKYPDLLKEVFISGKAHREVESVAYVMGDDGMSKFYLDFEYAPLFETDGSVSGIMVTVNDVTEKVNARKTVENAEERLRIALEAAELGTWELDLQTFHINFNPRLAEIFGHAPTETLTHQQLRSQIHPDDNKNIVEKAFEEALITKIYTYEARVIKPGNTVCWVRVQGKVFAEDGKPTKLLGTIRDITEDKFYEQELEESEQKFRLLADSTPQLIWTSDEKGNINYYNNAVYDYSGLTLQDLQGEGWLQIVHPDERQENLRLWERSIATGEDFIFEHRFRRFDGEYRWQLSRAIPQRDSEGVIQMWVGTSTDIHEIKELDQQKDYFISMASHELKTPVTSLKGYTQLLQSSYENSGDNFLINSLNIIDKQTVRLNKLISELLDLSKIKLGNLFFDEEYFDLNKYLSEVLEEKRMINPGFVINYHYKKPAPVCADKDRIRQVMANLVNNAIKYSSSSNVIDITSEVKGNEVIVTVKDYGIGILKKDQEKIFERFYRVPNKSTKTYPGFGIGLYIASEIVKRSNGTIGVTSEPGKGSSFYFSLPLKAAPAAD
ncbi:MAG: PAS domain S-box protein [Chitinophagaceae bacterium]|nr:PAS domain S-box protein [Chitinophagaceae bacterium]